MAKPKEQPYTPYYELEAVGNRVALATCRKCGMAIILNETDADSQELHRAFHKFLDSIGLSK